jgi:hypothetical protein
VYAVAVLGSQVGELLRAAGGGGDEVTRLERGADKRPAEAARGACDEPDLLHATQ